jgi:hypothetical protein
MSKARRLRALRQERQNRIPRGGRRISSMEDIAATEEVWTSDMPGRFTYLDDPVLGLGRLAAGVGSGGQVIDDSDTTDPIPVVLFEPVHVAMMTNTITGLVQEAKTDAIVASGFQRVPAGPLWTVQAAPGWEVRRVHGELVLRDGTGEVWARSSATPDPAWVSAATSQRDIIVFYGPKLGVRTPPGVKAARYGATERAAEFQQGRREGLVTAAVVRWQGQDDGEALEWSTFLPGSLGQPLAVVFAPEPNFTRHGGPDAFGLSRLGDNGLAVPAEPVRTVIARVSRTDIDLIDPAEAEPFNWLGGVHYREGVHPAWRESAVSNRQILLLTGRRLPLEEPADPGEAEEILGNLWGAIILAQPTGPRRK